MFREVGVGAYVIEMKVVKMEILANNDDVMQIQFE